MNGIDALFLSKIHTFLSLRQQHLPPKPYGASIEVC